MAVLCVHGRLLVLAVALPLCNAAGLESPVLQYAICKIGHNPFSFSVLMEMGCSTESQEQKPKREKEHYSKLNWLMLQKLPCEFQAEGIFQMIRI